MPSTKELRYFFFSQQLADGLRITAAVLLPAFVLNQFGLLTIGFALSLGAMCVSLTDAPGSVRQRVNGLIAATVFTFLVAVVTGFMRANVYTLALEIVLVTFFFSLLQVYGLRATSVGNAAILIMILTMSHPNNVPPVLYALYILLGGIWYIGLALFFYTIRPYRPAQRVLGDCIREVADYLSIKALFYNTHTDLQDDYKKLVAQQAVVHEKQDAVRIFFFKTSRIANETTETGRRLVATFVYAVDLFEDITATYYNYSTLRRRFQQSDVSQAVADVITQFAAHLDNIGIAIQSDQKNVPAFDADLLLANLKKKVDEIGTQEPEENTLVLKKILVNVRRIGQRIAEISTYFDKAKTFSKTHVDHTVFVEQQRVDPRLLWNNLNLKSSAFRHALRISIACLAGFTISKILAYGQHSYWVVLTIAFMLKPAFSLTKTRNVERIVGTLTGGTMGVLLLWFIKSTRVHFILMVLFMIGTYTFQRTRYLVMVICVTAYVLILFQFLNIPFITVVQERVFDTILGCVIAFSAGYFLFPDWEAQQLKKHMAGMLAANAAYLQKVTDKLEGKPVDTIDYKLARKQVYVQSANLSAAYQRMAAEPKKQQRNLSLVHQFLVRNHLLFSNIAHLAALIPEPAPPLFDLAQPAGKAVDKLYGFSKKLDPSAAVPENMPMLEEKENTTTHAVDALLKSNVDFVVKLCDDIAKTTEAILAA